MTAGPEGVVRFYNGRGTAEQWIKEGKYALNWTRLSCHRFVANRVASVCDHSGVQPRELPSTVMPAQGGQALVAAERAGQADQDGRPSGAALPVVDLSDVRSLGSSKVVRGECWIVSAGYRRRQAEGGYNHDVAKRESAPGSRLVFNAVSPHWRGPEDDKDGQETLVHGKNRIPYRIDRRWTGLAGPDYNATISLGLPFEPEDSQYGKYRLIYSH